MDIFNTPGNPPKGERNVRSSIGERLGAALAHRREVHLSLIPVHTQAEQARLDALRTLTSTLAMEAAGAADPAVQQAARASAIGHAVNERLVDA